MIKLFEKMLSHSVYRKTIYAYALSVAVISVLILAGAFGITSSQIKRQTVASSQQMLEQLVNSADRAQANVNNVMSVISGSGNTLRVVSEKEKNISDVYSLFLELSKWKGFYSYIENISVWNLNSGVCVHVLGDPEVGRENLELAESMQASRQYILCRDINIFQKKINVVSFFQYFPYQNSGIIVDVNSNLFQYSLLPGSDKQRETYVINEQGFPVMSAARGKIGDQEIAPYLFDVVSKSAQDEDRIVFDDRENRRVVFLAMSENYHWWFGDIQDYSVFYEEYGRITYILCGILGGFLLVLSIIMVLFSRRMRNHLLKIVNKCRSVANRDELLTEDELLYIDKAIAYIDHEAYVNQKYLQSWFLKNLLLGESMPFSLSRERIQQLRESFHSNYYSVLLIRLQSTKEIPKEDEKEEYSLLRFMVCNLADEIFGEAYRCSTVEVGEDMIAVLLFSGAKAVSNEYVLCFQQLTEFAKENLDLRLYGSMGYTVSSQSDICLSYQQAEEYMKMSRLIGKNDLIDSNQVTSRNYQKKNQKLVEAMIEYTRLNYKDPDLSLKTVSQMFHLTTAYVGKIFKSIQGVSYASFITEYRLQESKSLLLETSKTVGEISAEVGFANSTYFTTVFKNTYGMTPTAFRNQQ